MTEKRIGNYNTYQLNLSDEIVMIYIDRFNQRYPDDASLMKLVCGLYEGIEICRHCESVDLLDTDNVRKKKCAHCSKYTHLTAGTFFHCQKNLRGITLVIELLSHGIVLSSSRFHRLVGVAQSTALQMIKKVMTVIGSTFEDADTAISTSVFSKIFSRRSDETPAQKHPISEQEMATAELQKIQESNEAIIEQARSQKEVMGQLDSFQKKLYSHITKKPISFDHLERKMPKTNVSKILSGITYLEMYGLIEALPGNCFARFDRESQRNQNNLKQQNSANQKSFETIMKFIKIVSHGVSRKHLQRYISLFWCFYERDKWTNDALLQACARFKHVRDAEITQYVTPALMPIPAGCLNLPDMFG